VGIESCDSQRAQRNTLIIASQKKDMTTKCILCTVLFATTAMLTFPNQAHGQIRTLRIAFNAPNMASLPTAYALTLLQKEAEVLGVTIFPQDGKDSAAQQSGDLMNSVNMGLDAIILEPNDEESLSATVNDVLAANMPIVTISYRLKGIDKPICQLSDRKDNLGLTEQARTALKALISYVRDQKPLTTVETK
jgi:ABC-type sugar transport system substrate-binding protein